MSSKKKNPFEGRPFEWLNLDPNDFAGNYNFWDKSLYEEFLSYDWGTQQERITEYQKPIYDQCIKDAIEYFEPLGIKIATEPTRIRLPEPVKKRVVEFLKNRKKYYDENGLLITNEKGGDGNG